MIEQILEQVMPVFLQHGLAGVLILGLSIALYRTLTALYRVQQDAAEQAREDARVMTEAIVCSTKTAESMERTIRDLGDQIRRSL